MSDDEVLFNKFLGLTAYNLIKQVRMRRAEEEEKKTKPMPWNRIFKQYKNKFDKIAKKVYESIFKNKQPPAKDTDMIEFIKNEFNDDFANRYETIKEMDYAPTGLSLNKDDFEKLENHILAFITKNPEYGGDITGLTIPAQSKLSHFYNVINKTNYDNLSDVYNDITKYDTQFADDIKHKKIIDETIAEKDKEHAEEMREKEEEHANQRVRDAAKVKHHTKKEIERQMNYNDAELKDVKPIHEDYSDDSNNDIDIEDTDGINKKIVKYKEMDEAKNAAQQIDEKIKEDAIITRAAMDNDFYNQLDDGIKSALRPKIEEKKAIIERSKVIRYLLPKERPKWEKATMSKGVNPLLSRGAWGI